MNTIYLGASIAGLPKNKIFKSRPTELINKLRGKYSLIGQLFVEVEEMIKAQSEISAAGSVRNKAYRQTEE